MPSRTSARAMRDEGLERTDNEMEFTSWPQVSMINQKNYYTEFMKRDDQILALRLQSEDTRNRMTKAARDKDRTLAGADVDGDGDETMMGNDDTADDDFNGSRIIIIHPGSQNLRIGLSTDVIPKTVPMVIARKVSSPDHDELEDLEPLPKRRKVDFEAPTGEELFGPELAGQMSSLGADVKNRMRRKGRRIVPNAREQAISFNKKNPPTVITEHNDTNRVEWTNVLPAGSSAAPDFFTGMSALRIPDESQPRYKLFWPLRYGFFNEEDYESKDQILRDFTLIIEDAMREQLGLTQKKDWAQYSCVFVIPDLYERFYVTTVLDLLIREIGFSRVSFIQESLSGSFGAGYPTCVIVDVGARKTSICCVDEGMCIENSRINLRYGGDDVTELFTRMLLFDRFPYQELDLRKRHDFLLAEELKQKCCSVDIENIALQQNEFYVRIHGEDTRHYNFKVYDEAIMSVMAYFIPDLFDNESKLTGRRKLIDRSYDLYDQTPNDPVSVAQNQILDLAIPNGEALGDTSGPGVIVGTPGKYALAARLAQAEAGGNTPKRSVPPDDTDTAAGTPQPGRINSPAIGGFDKDAGGPQSSGAGAAATDSKLDPLTEMIQTAEVRDHALPTMPLEKAIMLSIEIAAKGDDRKMRDFFGGIVPVGGGAQIAGFNQFLEEELKEKQLRFQKDIMVAPAPREIDPQVLVWKGASVFGKLKTNDSWINPLEYDRLGNRILAYKTLWNF